MSGVTVKQIQKLVAEHYEIPLIDMVSRRRMRSVARPRQIAMYLARNYTSLSIPEIGRHFGNRDHTTVLHALQLVSYLADPSTAPLPRGCKTGRIVKPDDGSIVKLERHCKQLAAWAE